MFPLQSLRNNKIIFGILAFLILATLVGCRGLSDGESEKVSLPLNKSIPIGGKWKASNNLDKNDSKYTNGYAEFSDKGVLFGSDFFANPSYKIKRVNAEEYFLYHFGIDNLEYKSKDGLIEVVTVTSGNKYLYEFAIINNDKLITKVEDNVLYLNKVSSKVDVDILNKTVKGKSSSADTLIGDSFKDKDSGVLLGIKYLKGTQYNGTPIYGYKTLWICNKKGKLCDVLEMDDILLPRKYGFYLVASETKSVDNYYEDQIKVVNLSETKNTAPKQENKKTTDHKNISRNILFAGNDYLSLEVTKGNEADPNYDSRLILEPVDNLSDSNGVKISDICGEEGLKKMNEARATSLSDGTSILENTENDDFGLVRRAGHWYIKGRLSYEKEMEKKFKDYSINVIIPSKVVFYDTLFVPWTNVKDKIPDASDIFTSPSGNIAVIMAGNKLMVYGINGGELDATPKGKIANENCDSIVMAEWCTGNYTDYWEKAFKKQKYNVIYKN